MCVLGGFVLGGCGYGCGYVLDVGVGEWWLVVGGWWLVGWAWRGGLVCWVGVLGWCVGVGMYVVGEVWFGFCVDQSNP